MFGVHLSITVYGFFFLALVGVTAFEDYAYGHVHSLKFIYPSSCRCEYSSISLLFILPFYDSVSYHRMWYNWTLINYRKDFAASFRDLFFQALSLHSSEATEKITDSVYKDSQSPIEILSRYLLNANHTTVVMTLIHFSTSVYLHCHHQGIGSLASWLQRSKKPGG